MKACPHWCWKETSPAWLTSALGSACGSVEHRFLPAGKAEVASIVSGKEIPF